MEEKTKAKERRIIVEIRLQLDHWKFTEEVQTKFIATLAAIGNCPASAISIISVTSGCTVVTLRMPPSLANQILQLLYDYVHKFPVEGQPGANIDELSPASKELIGQYHLDAVNFAIDLTLISKKPPKHRAVIFVPGWTQNTSPFGNWPKDLFTLPGQLYPGFLAPVYDKGAKQASVETRTEALAGWVQQNFKQSKLAFVAHSLGGILVRRLITGQNLEQPISHLAFVASPHNMVKLADGAKNISGISAAQLARLSQDRGLLQALYSDWQKWVEKNVPNNCELLSIYTTADEVLKEEIPPKICLGEQITIIPDKNHSSIARPEATEDEAVAFRQFIMDGSFFDEKPNAEEDAKRARDIHLFFQRLYERTSAAPESPQPVSLQVESDRVKQRHHAVRDPKA